jgi:hypothetical protein
VSERRGRNRRRNVLDLWQNVLDDHDVDLADEIDELKNSVVELNAKLDRLVAAK